MTKLKWGETPWDTLPHDELLREVQRMYAALLHAHSVMKLSRGPDPEPNTFWDSEGGSGYRVMAMANQILNPIEAKFGSEAIYRSFFRYAVDLLFDGLGAGWVVLPEVRHHGRSRQKRRRAMHGEGLLRSDAKIAVVRPREEAGELNR